MSLKCDKNTCNTNLKWRYDTGAKKLYYGTSAKDFDLDTAYAAYKLVTQSYAQAVPTSATVPIINYCASCWLAKAASWDAQSGGNAYKTIPAKTADDGVFFQNDLADFEKPDGSPDEEKILSTIVHEMMHYLSHSHKGIQAVSKRTNSHWDEYITDLLARKTYHRASISTHYKTSYGLGSEFVSKSIDNIVGTPISGFQFNQLKPKAATESAPTYVGARSMPAAFAVAFSQLGTDKKLPAGQKAALQLAIEKWFVEWYLSGPDHKIIDALNKDLNEVLDSTFPGSDVIFGKTTDSNLQYGTPKEFTT
jgi:hypothetical protein